MTSLHHVLPFPKHHSSSVLPALTLISRLSIFNVLLFTDPHLATKVSHPYLRSETKTPPRRFLAHSTVNVSSFTTGLSITATLTPFPCTPTVILSFNIISDHQSTILNLLKNPSPHFKQTFCSDCPSPSTTRVWLSHSHQYDPRSPTR